MISKEEKELFREEVKDVKPLDKKYSEKVNIKKPVSKIRRKNFSGINFDDDVHEKILEYNNITPCGVDDFLFFVRSGVQEKTIKRLRQGKMLMQMKLDLHGLTVAEAMERLEDFLFYAQKNNIRTALIIHGKGSAKIKSAVNTWLKNYSGTLAFCSAQAKDGGLGAVYLLLKK